MVPDLSNVSEREALLCRKGHGKGQAAEITALSPWWDSSGLDPLAPGRRLALATCRPLHAKAAGPRRGLAEASWRCAGRAASAGRGRHARRRRAALDGDREIAPGRIIKNESVAVEAGVCEAEDEGRDGFRRLQGHRVLARHGARAHAGADRARVE